MLKVIVLFSLPVSDKSTNTLSHLRCTFFSLFYILGTLPDRCSHSSSIEVPYLESGRQHNCNMPCSSTNAVYDGSDKSVLLILKYSAAALFLLKGLDIEVQSL